MAVEILGYEGARAEKALVSYGSAAVLVGGARVYNAVARVWVARECFDFDSVVRLDPPLERDELEPWMVVLEVRRGLSDVFDSHEVGVERGDYTVYVYTSPTLFEADIRAFREKLRDACLVLGCSV